MLLNFWKCKCLHAGHGNLDVNYKMGDTVLGTTVKEKDLGVTISVTIRPGMQRYSLIVFPNMYQS